MTASGPILGRVVIATGNAGKARELEALLAGIASSFESLAHHPDLQLPPEGDASYPENALAKARAVHAALGVAGMGDDSGLEVDALGGAPGIRSARFAGENAGDRENNARLLQALREVPSDRRTARFRCALALVDPHGREIVVVGTCEGRILEAPRGNGGFGYDPLFLPEGETLTFAELPQPRKFSISHRGRAATALREVLFPPGPPPG
ncbi:MAG TPA: RdgB/HAM1 family non-canonical purine NTP pyrophosphatase [Candidatus Eisenbacteria bacterium]|nr:RdgB/HAM1 family non-canonical purine NTP pyrophosphatase [Candidatus Eisenbacteria bacterium]